MTIKDLVGGRVTMYMKGGNGVILFNYQEEVSEVFFFF